MTEMKKKQDEILSLVQSPRSSQKRNLDIPNYVRVSKDMHVNFFVNLSGFIMRVIQLFDATIKNFLTHLIPLWYDHTYKSVDNL